MKLLIVDDEELTRNGLIKSFSWDAMGIDTILQADDGLNGLSIARSEKPDIILCDVRMPRLDGIQMLEKIQETQPTISAIFMSGYSDKEYLKSAIKLGAINYVEKPIDPDELEEAIHQAIEQCQRIARQNDAEAANTNQAADSLAYHLTTPYLSCKETVDELCRTFYEHYSADKFKYINTFIVKLDSASAHSAEFPYIYQTIRAALAPMHLHVIYTEKRLFHLVYHVYGSNSISPRALDSVCDILQNAFQKYGDFYMVVGDTVQGISNVYRSYESAVILLQSSFFYNPGTVLKTSDFASDTTIVNDNLQLHLAQFAPALTNVNKDATESALNAIYSTCAESVTILPNHVKSAYFELFSKLYAIRNSKQLMPDLSLENNESIMDIMDSCFSYNQLHSLLCEKTQAYFKDLDSNVSENATIYLIKNYISTHYTNPSLSVKDISDYAHLSVSYLCTFFKSETGTTLNQYITEFRMDKAKQLLMDPRNRVADISAKIGYNDGNYFGKSFKKLVGLSPSEYREKVMK